MLMYRVNRYRDIIEPVEIVSSTDSTVTTARGREAKTAAGHIWFTSRKEAVEWLRNNLLNELRELRMRADCVRDKLEQLERGNI